MCKDCLKEFCPDRGRVCQEKGAYLLNYGGCKSCQRLGHLIERNHSTSEDDDEETVNYDHVCPECDHVVANHSYSFSTDGEYQEYSMECSLCGHGGDTVSVLPDDPREKALF